MKFGCGAVGKAASDCVGGPTGESKEGYVTTSLGVVISPVFLTPIPLVLTAIGLHYVGSVKFSSDHTSLCPQGRRLRPDLGANTISYNKRVWRLSFLIMVPLVLLLLLD